MAFTVFGGIIEMDPHTALDPLKPQIQILSEFSLGFPTGASKASHIADQERGHINCLLQTEDVLIGPTNIQCQN